MKPWFGPRRAGWGIEVRRWPGYLVFFTYLLACGLVGGAAPDQMTLAVGELVVLYFYLAVVASTWDHSRA